MARTMVDKAKGNGAVPLSNAPRLEPPTRQRGRLPELVVGIIVMVAFALGAVLVLEDLWAAVLLVMLASLALSATAFRLRRFGG